MKIHEFQAKEILANYNVPIQNGLVVDDYRIKKTLPTLRYCLDHGASITIISHLGRPKGVDENLSLSPVCDKLSELLQKEIIFSEDCISDKAFVTSSSLKKGQIHMLENLRFHSGELTNDKDFSSNWHSSGGNKISSINKFVSSFRSFQS